MNCATLAPAPEAKLPGIELAGGMLYCVWLKSIGVCRRTGIRWRQEGKVKVIHRNGMQFVTADEIRRFFQDDGSRTQRGWALKGPRAVAPAFPEPA